ncbi:MAG: GNAT family N-acetyltransferase [Oscillospiraceae bacterium]|nr:GNAT family N-acetyltransferase [Oscillospiraceae bacterium]
MKEDDCMEIKIRKAGREDTECYLAFLHDIKNAMVQGDWFYLDPDEDTREMMAEGSMQLWFAQMQDRIAGVFSIIVPGKKSFNLGCDLGFDEEMLSRVVHMDTAAVHPDFRGHDLQHRMMMAAEEELRAIGGRILLCTIHPDNRYSVQNVLKQGYTIEKKLEKYGGSIRYILRKDLP